MLKVGHVSPEAYHWLYAISTFTRLATLALLWRLPRVAVPAAATALSPTSVRPNANSLDEMVLPGLPDQVTNGDEKRVAPPERGAA